MKVSSRNLKAFKNKEKNDTIKFLGLWETIHNPDFKPIEFDRFRNEAGSNAFTLSPQKWIEKTRLFGKLC